MNVTNLPTNTFSVSNTLSEANVYGSTTDSKLGSADYTLLMWCSSATAFFGDGKPGSIPSTDKLGGFVVKMVNATDLNTPWISRLAFEEIQSSYTMLETYGSDFSGFSSGGYVWASQPTFNILAPAANMVGSYFRGTVTFGQLPSTPDVGLSL